MIELVNVTQHYGVRPVLKKVNLRIERGELVVIVWDHACKPGV